MSTLNFKTYFELLTEALPTSGNYVDIIWIKGGIPDLSGPAKSFSVSALWATPARNRMSSQKYKGALLNDGRVLFFKHPAKFTKENILPKLERYLDEQMGYSDQITKIFEVLPEVINKIGKRVCTYEAYKSHGEEMMQNKKIWGRGTNLAKLASKTYGDGTDPELTGNRDEINSKIKEKATALAREKMRVLMSNGVSREDALSAAKEAYKKFLKTFYNESSLSKVNAAPAHVRPDYHPIMSKTGETLKAAKDQNAKESAMKLYRRLVQQGKPIDSARAQAMELYNKLAKN